MRMDEGLDTGPVLRQRSLALTGEETTATLTSALSRLGAELLPSTLDDWVAGRIAPQPQDNAQATYAPLLKKADGVVRWEQDAANVCRHVRAMQPWPGAVTFWQDRQVKILRARPLAAGGTGAPGTVFAHEKGLAVTAGSGVVVLDEVQLAGKRALPAADFRHGYGAVIGAVLKAPRVVS